MLAATQTAPATQTIAVTGGASASVSKGKLWTARIMMAIVTLFLLFDGGIHLARIPEVEQASAQLGYPAGFATTLGVIELACVLLYALRRTSILGAVLLTGYMGGAIATNIRIGAPLFSHVLFPVYVAILIWGALWLRDGRLRAIMPLRG